MKNNKKKRLAYYERILKCCREHSSHLHERDKQALIACADEITQEIRLIRYELHFRENVEDRLEAVENRLNFLSDQIYEKTGKRVMIQIEQEIRFQCLTGYRGKMVFLNQCLPLLDEELFPPHAIRQIRKEHVTDVTLCIGECCGTPRDVIRNSPVSKAVLHISVDECERIADLAFGVEKLIEVNAAQIQENWSDFDIDIAERFLSMISGEAWIEKEPFAFIDHLLVVFAARTPAPGFELPYLDAAAELVDLYGEALVVVEENRMPEAEERVRQIAREIRAIVF